MIQPQSNRLQLERRGNQAICMLEVIIIPVTIIMRYGERHDEKNALKEADHTHPEREGQRRGPGPAWSKVYLGSKSSKLAKFNLN